MEATSAILDQLYDLTAERQQNPVAGSYTNYLLDKGQDRILSKIGEQCLSLILASKNQDKQQIELEMADLLYHLTVLLYSHDLQWDKIYTELAKRRQENT